MLFLVSVAVAIAGAAAARWLLVHARQLLMRRSRRHVLVVVGVSAALGLLGPASPTGNFVLDAVYRAVLAGAVALAASRARRWTWIVAAGAAVIADHGSAARAVLARSATLVHAADARDLEVHDGTEIPTPIDDPLYSRKWSRAPVRHCGMPGAAPVCRKSSWPNGPV